MDDLEIRLQSWGRHVVDSEPRLDIDPSEAANQSGWLHHRTVAASFLSVGAAVALVVIAGTLPGLPAGGPGPPSSPAVMTPEALPSGPSVVRASPEVTTQAVVKIHDVLVHSCGVDDPIATDLSLKLSQRFGDTRVRLYGSDTYVSACSVGLDRHGNPEGHGLITMIHPLEGDLSVDATMQGEEAPDYSIAIGRTSKRVAAVDVVLVDGVRLSALVGDQYYLASWLGSTLARSVVAYDSSGEILERVGPRCSSPGCQN